MKSETLTALWDLIWHEKSLKKAVSSWSDAVILRSLGIRCTPLINDDQNYDLLFTVEYHGETRAFTKYARVAYGPLGKRPPSVLHDEKVLETGEDALHEGDLMTLVLFAKFEARGLFPGEAWSQVQTVRFDDVGTRFPLHHPPQLARFRVDLANAIKVTVDYVSNCDDLTVHFSNGHSFTVTFVRQGQLIVWSDAVRVARDLTNAITRLDVRRTGLLGNKLPSDILGRVGATAFPGWTENGMHRALVALDIEAARAAWKQQ